MKNQSKNEFRTLDDFVFQNKNHEYGAFHIRKSYESTIRKSFIIGSSLFFGAFFVSNIYAKRDKAIEGPIGPITLEHLPPVTETRPPVELPPPPVEPQQSTLRNLPPEIVETPIIEDTPPTQTDLAEKPSGVVTIDVPDDNGPIVIDERPKEVEPVEIKPEEPEIFTVLEQQASYPGGWAEMGKFLAKNLKYPNQAAAANVAGKVFLSFIVDKDGKISNVELQKGIGFGCDEEAIRVVKKMPNWNPGKQSGRPVKSKFNLPIAFVLE